MVSAAHELSGESGAIHMIRVGRAATRRLPRSMNAVLPNMRFSCTPRTEVTRKRGAFPNPDSVRNVLYLADDAAVCTAELRVPDLASERSIAAVISADESL